METLSLNGLDGSGKSQQIRLLSFDAQHMFHVPKPLVRYSPRWPTTQGADFSRWWFEEVTAEELADIIIESLNHRDKDRSMEKIVVLDRGCRMFKSVCAAMLMMQKPGTMQEALVATDRRFLERLDHEPKEREVLFLPDNDYLRTIANIRDIVSPSGVFPEAMRERYARYQTYLREAVRLYFADSSPYCVRVDAHILDIQNRVRQLLREEVNLKLPNLGDRVHMVVGFGGLSECGKSSFAEHLRIRHGFYRLKLRYFMESLDARGEKVTPEKVALELLRFLQRHYYVERISIESLHDPYIPAFLKLMWGHRFRAVYIETDRAIRCRRAARELGIDIASAAAIVDAKDATKMERGAYEVRQIADVVYDNSSDDLPRSLENFESLLK